MARGWLKSGPAGACALALLLLISSTICKATESQFTDPYTADATVRDRVLSFINSASSTLDIAIYTFTYARNGNTLSQFASALAQARSRGVQVRIVTDEDEVSSPSSSQFVILDTIDGNRNGTLNPAVVRAGNPTGIMHDKFMIADGNRVLTGSTNWTESAMFDQENNILILDGAQIAGVYEDEFEEMWNGTFGNDNDPTPQHSYTTSDGIPVEIWFGADDDLTGRLVSAINAATSSVYFSVYVFSTGSKANLIGAALKSAKARGVDVRGVMDQNLDQWSSLTSSPNAIPMGDYIPVSGGIMHSKYMVVDAGLPTAKALSGSDNWSTGADTSNDENLVILNSGWFANRYYDNFRKLYVERSDNGGGAQPVRRFGDLNGDNQLTSADFDLAQAIATGQQSATPLQLIVGDVAPVAGVNGHIFGDGVIDYQDVVWLADELGIPLDVGTDRIGDILGRPNGASVDTEPLVVTAVFGPAYYVEQADRASGIRVQGGVTPALGDRVSVKGEMAQISAPRGERYINASQTTIQTHSNPLPEALEMASYQAGGEALNSYTPGITGAWGLYNIGLRACITGRVSGFGSLSFWVDDGSGLDDGSGNIGIKVNSGALVRPPAGSLVKVTGIVTMEQNGLSNIRALRPAAQADIITLQ